MTVAELPKIASRTGARTADLTVVGGAGHVGIPLVLSFAAKGLSVNVNDLNLDNLAALKSGRLPFIEYGAEQLLTGALRDKRLTFTSNPGEISGSGPVIVTIGTPVDEFLNPERQVIQDCIDVLLPHLRDGQLLVLRSTLYPGTTDWINAYLTRQGRSLKVAFCPERIVQGHGVDELARMPQIVSGTTAEAAEEAAALFRIIAPEIVVLDPIEAEFAKLFGNAYRYIEFAITNQFYLIAKSAGLDYQRILQAMKHNYPRARNIPSPGYAAGPCLMKDTMQLTAFARNEFSLGNAAMLVNEGLPLHIVDDLRRRYDLGRMTVGLLGMAFKSEIDDIRASLSYKFKKVLNGYAREVLTTDPFVTADPDLLPFDEVVARSDILILCTPHGFYRTADLMGKPVIDVWGMLQNTPEFADSTLVPSI
ncbi:nucleotide sugar dehydrogenase [Bradyrhizobium sp.]|uniref:nucleotide sugar dehydrogenase n=1 Tax=Bradyrhizobium sp. TaxID=376 RepID=UPI0025BB3456|nr:nucleotide sugar dehydrogenase [Bradyrhizobium sp.]